MPNISKTSIQTYPGFSYTPEWCDPHQEEAQELCDGASVAFGALDAWYVYKVHVDMVGLTNIYGLAPARCPLTTLMEITSDPNSPPCGSLK